MPWLRNLIWKLRKSFYAAKRILFVKKSIADGSLIIKNAIEEQKPFSAGKMGSVEASAIREYLKRIKTPDVKENAVNIDYSPYVFHTLHVNAGVFPQDTNIYDGFCDEYLNAITKLDVIAAWDIAGEAEVFRTFGQDAELIKLRNLEPYFSDIHWSQALLGKRVLVISPFSESIKKQYAKRNEIWPNKNILPDFDLLTIKAPLSAGIVKPESEDWFEALNKMKDQMDTLDYDVAMIGAGAFSLPLAAHAKDKGKIGLHLGGALQILFGIVGKRWREHKDFKPFINESWCAPDKSETPDNITKIEGGCYW